MDALIGSNYPMAVEVLTLGRLLRDGTDSFCSGVGC